MKIDEINEQKWNVSKSLKTRFVDIIRIPTEDWECHFNVSRADDQIMVDCSLQSWITKLSKSSLFTLQRVLVSSNDSNSGGNVLSITGILHIRALSVRNKFMVLSDGEKQRRTTILTDRHNKLKSENSGV